MESFYDIFSVWFWKLEDRKLTLVPWEMKSMMNNHFCNKNCWLFREREAVDEREETSKRGEWIREERQRCEWF